MSKSNIRRAYLLVSLLSVALLASSCGDDESNKKPKRKRTVAAKTAIVVGGTKAGLAAYRKIDDVAIVESAVHCQKTCKDAKEAPKCIQHCLSKEAWALRHDYSQKRDAPRDPFHSYVLKTDVSTDGIAPGPNTLENYCPPKDRRAPDLRASTMDPRARRSFSYRSLTLKGIIGRGTKRQALFGDSTGFSHIVQKGDCLGKEKARVKEIGVEVVVLELKTEESKPPVPLKPIELHPSDVLMGETIDDGNRTSDIMPRTKVPGVLNRRLGRRPHPSRRKR